METDRTVYEVETVYTYTAYASYGISVSITRRSTFLIVVCLLLFFLTFYMFTLNYINKPVVEIRAG